MAAGIPPATFRCCFFSTQTVLFLEAVQDSRHGLERDIERLRDALFRLSGPEKKDDHLVPRRRIPDFLAFSYPGAAEIPFRQRQPFIPG